MSVEVIYGLLYVLLHGVFRLYEWFSQVVLSIGGVFVDFYHEFALDERTNCRTHELIKGGKLPRHLTVLLGSEPPSYGDLANIVSWCLGSGIGYLSFYDAEGVTKTNRDRLEKELGKILLPEDRIVWHDSAGATYKNGFIGRKVHVKLLSRDDGKRNVARVARETFGGTKDSEEISIQSLDRALRADFEFPDPDMAICCGKQLVLNDYPPWQLRVTEFFSVKSHFKFKHRMFLKMLHVYATCEQRLGK